MTPVLDQTKEGCGSGSNEYHRPYTLLSTRRVRPGWSTLSSRPGAGGTTVFREKKGPRLVPLVRPSPPPLPVVDEGSPVVSEDRREPVDTSLRAARDVVGGRVWPVSSPLT